MAVVSLEAEQDAEKFSEPAALRKLARTNKYEIKAVSWCPHHAKQGLLASAVSDSPLLPLSLSLSLSLSLYHSYILCAHHYNIICVHAHVQCQQKVEIWDVKAERHPLLQSIKAHTRPVRFALYYSIHPMS